MSEDIGSVKRLRVHEIKDDDGVLADPDSIVLSVRAPDGTMSIYIYEASSSEEPRIMRTGTGDYFFRLQGTETGAYEYRWKWSGGADGEESGTLYFGVNPLLEPFPDGTFTAAEVWARSLTLKARYPQGSGDGDFDLLVAAVAPLVGDMTGRAIAGTEGEEVPEDKREVALRVMAMKTEQFDAALGSTKARRRSLNRGNLASFSAGAYCVPMDTEALTSKGWRNYGDLCVGDLVLGFDQDADVARWTPITNIRAPFESEVVKLGNGRWSLRCTPDHRWISRDDRWCVRDQENPWEMTKTRELLEGERRLVLAAPAETERKLDISPPEAALIAWLLTDGHIERREEAVKVEAPPLEDGGTRCLCGAFIPYGGRGMPRHFCDDCAPVRQTETRDASMRGRIFQKHYREEVESVLTAVAVPHSVRERGEQGGVYSLGCRWLADLWERACFDELGPSGFVLALDRDQREAFLEAGLLAEGHLASATAPLKAKGNYGPWYRWQFAQNKGPVLDAFVLAAHLCGYVARTWKTKAKCSGFICGAAHATTQRLRVEPDGRGLVWCITTELGTWTMRQGNIIALTGNSESYFGPEQAMLARRLDPDPILAELLWALCTAAKREEWLAFWDPENNPQGVGGVVSFQYGNRPNYGTSSRGW